jgi:hypothetical protein
MRALVPTFAFPHRDHRALTRPSGQVHSSASFQLEILPRANECRRAIHHLR